MAEIQNRPYALAGERLAFEVVDSLQNVEDDSATRAYLMSRLFRQSEDVKKSDMRPVEFHTFTIPLNLHIGSLESMALHEALADLGSSGIFLSSAVKKLIEYKWRRLYVAAYLYASIYLAYLLNTVLYPSWIAVLGWSLVRVAIIALLMTGSRHGYKTYFKSLWHWNDTFRTVVAFMYIGFYWWYIRSQSYDKNCCLETKSAAVCGAEALGRANEAQEAAKVAETAAAAEAATEAIKQARDAAVKVAAAA